MVRFEIQKLIAMGPLPSENTAAIDALKEYEFLLQSVSLPLSDQEVKELIHLFGTDSCYGLAWTLLHLIESTPNWPTLVLSNKQDNVWIKYLIERKERFWGA